MSPTKFVSSSTSLAEGFWKVADVARLLGMSRQWVYKNAELGVLPCIRLGASLRFQPAEIRRYIESQTRRSPSTKLLPFHPAG